MASIGLVARWFAVIAVVFASLGLAIAGAAARTAASGAGQFLPAGTLAQPRALHSMTPLADGRVLIAGGSVGFRNTNAVEIWDPRTETSQLVPEMRAARILHTATLLRDGRVLIAGGWRSRDDAEIFGPATETWSPAGNMRFGRSDASATRLADGRVLIVSGFGAREGASSSVDLFDPTSNRFVPAADLPGHLEVHRVLQLQDGNILIFAWYGLPGSLGAYPSLIHYDPESGGRVVWTQSGMLPAGLTGGAQLQRLALSGAANRKANPLTATELEDGTVLLTAGLAWLFNPNTEEALVLPSYASAHRPEFAHRLPDGRVLLTAWEFRAPGDESIQADLFNPATRTFEAAGEIPGVGVNRSETLLPDGSVLISGGQSDSLRADDAETRLDAIVRYVPQSPPGALPTAGSGGLAGSDAGTPAAVALIAAFVAALLAGVTLTIGRRTGRRARRG